MRRTICPKCQFPKQTCICNDLVELHNPIQVIVLQHPSEEKVHKNTVRILEKCLNNIQVCKGEQFDPQTLGLDNLSHVRLVFPDSQEESTEYQGLASKDQQANPNQFGDTESIEALILIDGTWKKAKKIYYLNKWLQALPKFALQDLPSNYWIRSPGAKIKNSLSTLEATAYSLQYFLKDDSYLKLLQPLNAFQAHQGNFIPDEHKRKDR